MYGAVSVNEKERMTRVLGIEVFGLEGAKYFRPPTMSSSVVFLIIDRQSVRT